MEQLRKEHERLEDKANLSRGILDVQNIIDQIKTARQTVQLEPSDSGQILKQLESGVKRSFDRVNDDLKDIHGALNKYSKAMEKKFKDNKPVAFSENETLSTRPILVNRAIAMHLLREGHFDVASSFITEANANASIANKAYISMAMDLSHSEHLPEDIASLRQNHLSQQNWSADLAQSQNSAALQQQFEEMYTILKELKQNRNLNPAIQWARDHRAVLDKRGSNLEFDLSRLQYIALFTSKDRGEGPLAAVDYARATFPHFTPQYNGQIRQVLGALAFAGNLQRSPYVSIFSTSSSDNTTTAAATAFTSEFCALLSLSSASPLLTAVTAGCIALPTLFKFSQIQTTKRTTWTTPTELPVEISLPPSFRFHSIFVCPVSKEQSTDTNPPMMMPCAHVVAQESLEKLGKGGRFKCPYCPNESHLKDAREVFL